MTPVRAVRPSASKRRLPGTFRNFHWPKEVTDVSWAPPLKREKRAKLSLRLITDYRRLKVLESLDLDLGDPKRRANGEKAVP
jgi:hypothetical protein